MRRGTLVLLFFVIVVGGIIGVSTLLQNQPPLMITIAVSPLIRGWAEETVREFNASKAITTNGRRVEAQITVIEDLDAWRNRTWTAQSHPDAWIPASAASVSYARDAGMPFEGVSPSVGNTPLVWGAYLSRANILTEEDTITLDWAQVVNAAQKQSWQTLGGQSGWQFVDLAFPLPDQTMTGLAVLLSGAANMTDTAALDNSALQNQMFRDSMSSVIASVPNFNNVGTDVGDFLAQRGLSGADIGIAPESQWLNKLANLTRDEAMRFSYPEYTFLFDFPLVLWQSNPPDADVTLAVNRLNEWLLSETQQFKLPKYGLRSMNIQITAADALFGQAEQYGIQLNPQFTQIIQPPTSSTEIQSLIRWSQGVLR